MNIGTWVDMLHDDAFSTRPEALPCDHCEELKCEESSDWIQSPLDKALYFCCEECKKEWEQNYMNETN